MLAAVVALPWFLAMDPGLTTPPSYALDQAPIEGLWFSAQAGGGIIDGDVVAGLSTGVGMETRPFAVHLRAPLTLRVVDLPPASSAGLPSECRIVRCEEWFEAGRLSPRALTRVMDELRVLHAGDAFHLRGGPLFATLGHGQLVSRTTSAADWDRRTSGLYAESNLPWGRTQAQALVASFLSPQELFGARITTSPLLSDETAPTAMDRFLGRLRVGFEVAGDAVAPVGNAIDAFGDLAPGGPSRPLVGLATDVTWPLLDGGGALQLEPWVGASSMIGLRSSLRELPGFGAGATAGLDLSLDLVVVALRAGGQLVVDSAGHRSSVFSTLYTVDRRRYAKADGSFSSTGVADLPAPGGVGGGGQLEFLALRTVRLGGRLHVDPVAEATQVELYGQVGAGPVWVGARVLERAISAPDRAVALDDRTFVVAEAAWAVFAPFSVTARWLHTPRFEDAPPPGRKPGDPVADDDIFVGVSFDLVLSSTS